MLHGAVGPVMLELHADGTLTWRPIYQSARGRKFVQKDDGGEENVDEIRTEAAQEES